METTEQSNKVRITAALIEDWTLEAISRYETGDSEKEILEYLKSCGCTPKIRERILHNAKGNVKSVHRGAGFRAFLSGAALLVVSWLLLRTIYGGIEAHATHIRGGGKVLILGVLSGLAGAGFCLLGIFKFVTGSTMDIEPDE
jgi:hypothetical protein